jgi:putative nucleotidyltransferase with HDIG domain
MLSIEGGSLPDRLEQLRASVRGSLPEVDQISDPDLRRQVIEIHALALSETEYERIEDMPLGDPGEPPLPKGTQADHYRGVARMAVALADGLEAVMGPLEIDRDLLIAGALCHDVGKAYEFSPRNRERWESIGAKTGKPAVRHPAYGAHLAFVVGLPEPVVHCIAAHSMHAEGKVVEASLETKIVQYVDVAFWEILERAGVVPLEPQSELAATLLGR